MNTRSAAVGAADALTFGAAMNDEYRQEIADFWGVDASSGYYAAGMIVGNLTASVAIGMVSGGLANVSCIGSAANIARVVGQSLKAAMVVSDAYTVAGAVNEFGETGHWGLNQTLALATVAGHGIGYAAGKLKAPVCFVEGTQVATRGEDGEITGKNIEQIEVGDLVWARDEQTGENGWKPVVTVFVNTTDTLVHLTYTAGSLGNEATLIGTPGHPFWSVDAQDWVGMHELRPGETLLAHGTAATVTNTRTEHLTTPTKIYNFEVADWHTYHVGAAETGWVWVHNRGGCGPDHLARQQHILETAGGRMERRIPLTNGRYRIADNIDAADRVHQVGAMRARGGRFSPSGRERAAIEDIRKARPNATIIFHDKFNKGPSLINPDLRPGWRPAPRKLRYDP